jgi:hypothetical protein
LMRGAMSSLLFSIMTPQVSVVGRQFQRLSPTSATGDRTNQFKHRLVPQGKILSRSGAIWIARTLDPEAASSFLNCVMTINLRERRHPCRRVIRIEESPCRQGCRRSRTKIGAWEASAAFGPCIFPMNLGAGVRCPGFIRSGGRADFGWRRGRPKPVRTSGGSWEAPLPARGLCVWRVTLRCNPTPIAKTRLLQHVRIVEHRDELLRRRHQSARSRR